MDSTDVSISSESAYPSIIQGCPIIDPPESPFASALSLVASIQPPSAEDIKARLVSLGPKVQKHTLVLDIDHTLVFSELAQGTEDDPDSVACVVNIRPHALELISRMSTSYEIVLFTAGSKQYAELIRERLDPEKKYIKMVLGQESCILTPHGHFVKDLRIFVDRELSNILIVDDHILSFAFQLENGIPVAPYNGEDRDDELNFLMTYLDDLSGSEDIRAANRERIRLIQS